MEAIRDNDLFESIEQYLDAGAKPEEVAGTLEIERRKNCYSQSIILPVGFVEDYSKCRRRS